MTLIFHKKENEIEVKIQCDNNTEIDFSYRDVVKELYANKKIEYNIVGEFTKEEKENIETLISDINKIADDKHEKIINNI